MITALILSIILVVLFVGFVIYKDKKFPESISAMVYTLPGDWKWIWSIWMVAVSILTYAPTIQILDPRGLGFLGFLSMVCLCFVAVWPLFDLEHRKLHYTLAIIGGILTQVCVAFINPYWLFLWIIIPGIVIYDLWKNKKFLVTSKYGVMIAEIICYLTTIGSQLIYKL